MAQIGDKLLNCAKRDLWRKLTKTTFVNLLYPIMLKCFQKICDRWYIRLNNFGANWAQIVLLHANRIFWENWLILLLSTSCAPLSYNVWKISLVYGRSWDIRCCSFGPNWRQITQLFSCCHCCCTILTLNS